MSDYGSLQEVVVVPRGSSLTTAAAISDTELVVDSAGDFDEDGGTLELNGVQLEYTGITWGVAEDDADTIVLTDALAAAADEDDAVAPVAGGLAVEDWYAVVDMGPGDAVHIPLTFAQRVLWPEGTYPDVPVIVSDNLQLIEDAPGRPAAVGGRTEAWNEDEWNAAGDDSDSPGTLTYLPKPHSLTVEQNGVRLRNSEFTLVDQVVTPLAAETTIRAADVFTAYYDRDLAGEVVNQGTDPTPMTLVGYNSDTGSLSSLALPAGTQAGDLIVLATCNWTAGSSSDPRLTLRETFPGQFVDIGRVYTGTEDGSGDPIALSVSSLHDFTIVAVFRDATVLDTQASSDTSPVVTPTNAPTVSAAKAAINVTMMRTGVSTGGITHTPGGLATVVAGNEGGGVVNIEISAWSDNAPQTSPADSFAFGGSVDGWGMVTFKVDA